jgi:hypothetical protein
MVHDLKIGDVVQLTPMIIKNVSFAGCFMIITELRSWGAIGYIPCVGKSREKPYIYHYRATFEEIVKIGRAKYVLEDELLDEKSI